MSKHNTFITKIKKIDKTLVIAIPAHIVKANQFGDNEEIELVIRKILQ